MKMTAKLTVLLGACGALVLTSTLAARAEDTPFYGRLDLGGNWSRDLELKEFFGPVAAGSKVRLDPGLRAGVAGGYQLTDWFAGEVQVGYFENRINSITGATRIDQATFSNVPFLVNAKLQYANRTRFTPYIGGGLGASVAIIDARHIDLNGIRLRGTGADAVFAYQGFAGIRYALSDRMGVSLEYRYFAADSPSWQADLTDGTGSGYLRLGRSETHSVSLAFDFHF